MLSENKQFAIEYNLIQWHEKGFTGKGIRIAVFDEGCYARTGTTYTQFPFSERSISATHGTNVGGIINQFAPDAEIFMLRLIDATTTEKIRNAKWIADPINKIDLISCSCILGATQDDEYWKILKNSGIPLICAAGNSSKEKEYNDNYPPASFTWSFAIGAISDYNDQKSSYSNYGEILKCMSYSSPYLQIESGAITSFSGTSFCQPQVCGVLACLLQAAKEVGVKYTRETLLEFISKNCKDLYTVGKDTMSGYGLIHLPDVNTYLEENSLKIVMTVGNNIAMVDGIPVVMSAPMANVNGSVLAPVRFIGEQAGFKVTWDNVTKTATLEK